MGISLEGQEENVTLKDIKDIIKNQDPENMLFITFESIKKTYKIANIAKEARKQIIDN